MCIFRQIPTAATALVAVASSLHPHVAAFAPAVLCSPHGRVTPRKPTSLDGASLDDDCTKEIPGEDNGRAPGWPVARQKSSPGVAVVATALAMAVVLGPMTTMPLILDDGAGALSEQCLLVSERSVANAAVAPPADVGLPGFLVKDGKQLLRLNLPTSLPTSQDPAKLEDFGRQVQEAVELVKLRLEQVGFSRKAPVWNTALKDVKMAKKITEKSQNMLKGISDDDLKRAKGLLGDLDGKLAQLAQAVIARDKVRTLQLQDDCSRLAYDIRVLSMPKGVLPYEVPLEYDSLPQLRGRAVVECILSKAGRGTYTLGDGQEVEELKLTLTVDGYHAPLTAGNFVELVQRKFYNGLTIQQDKDLTLQTGQPESDKTDGFIDPITFKKRIIPLELFYKKDSKPTYMHTSDEDMRATETMALPFQAYGALGMTNDSEDPNSASSQFFFLRWDPALVVPSRNTLDGSQACFGYVTENQDTLKQVEKGDLIVSMRVTEGLENLFLGKRGGIVSADKAAADGEME